MTHPYAVLFPSGTPVKSSFLAVRSDTSGEAIASARQSSSKPHPEAAVVAALGTQEINAPQAHMTRCAALSVPGATFQAD